MDISFAMFGKFSSTILLKIFSMPLLISKSKHSLVAYSSLFRVEPLGHSHTHVSMSAGAVFVLVMLRQLCW